MECIHDTVELGVLEARDRVETFGLRLSPVRSVDEVRVVDWGEARGERG